MEDEIPERGELVLYGIPASPGVMHGPVFRFLHDKVEVPHYTISNSDKESEFQRFKDALQETHSQISQIREGVAKNLGQKEAGIFDAHLLVLEDKAFIDDIELELEKSEDNVEQCLHRVSERYLEYFGKIEDEYLRERAVDLQDITRRLMMNLVGASGAGTALLDEPRILVSEDLTPSDTASLDRTKLMGIATESGGKTSHAVIMARASGVPAVVGLKQLTEKLSDQDTLLIDGFEGVAIINPEESTLFRYGKVKLRRKKIRDLLEEQAHLPAQTKDGSPVGIFVNADSSDELEKGIEYGCEGVGLLRTESIFLKKNSIPSENEQFEEYRLIVERANPLPVTIRTLDLGGDKILGSSSRESEQNPFMGFRAIRYCLRNPAIFLDQLRAILRVSALGKVKLMFPMISGVGELIRAKEFLFTAKRQLRESGKDFDEDILVGCMIETPAAVTICDLIADEVDFLSVGTNDLVQYLLAVDRVNNEIAYLYEPHHPAVVRSIRHILQISNEKDTPVTICGEIAGDPHFLPLLLGMGVVSLSASAPLIPELKFFASRFETSESKELIDRILSFRRPSEVIQSLKNFYDERVADLVD
ncbi:MAG: phosphoenolpyruvate--protein phosphotransferase [Verrucomicrobiota bacterium]|nr:phosphoenolpyruvate--protein phosphotransferase [Verrucomicrobiota bacterium]